jgi:hypothetical protein
VFDTKSGEMRPYKSREMRRYRLFQVRQIRWPTIKSFHLLFPFSLSWGLLKAEQGSTVALARASSALLQRGRRRRAGPGAARPRAWPAKVLRSVTGLNVSSVTGRPGPLSLSGSGVRDRDPRTGDFFKSRKAN